MFPIFILTLSACWQILIIFSWSTPSSVLSITFVDADVTKVVISLSLFMYVCLYIYIYNFYLKTRKGITVSLKLWSSCLTEGKKHITARKCFSVENIFGDPDILVFYWHGFREQRARHLRHRTCNQKLCYILGIWLQLPINQIRHSVKEKNIRQPYHILLKTRQSGERTK